MDTSMLLLFGFLAHTFITTGAQIGVSYGQLGNNLPCPEDVVRLYQANGIQRMRLYYPDPATLDALRGSNIQLMLDVPNQDLQSLTNPSAATNWVQTNIRNYIPDVKFNYISVGNEVHPNNDNAKYVPFVLPALQNVHDAIVAAGLECQIQASTTTGPEIIGKTSPPSNAEFLDDAKPYINPIVRFLADNNLPFFASIYPYFSVKYNPSIDIKYALFTSPGVVVQDGDLGYQNLFDALVDVEYSALEKSLGDGALDVQSDAYRKPPNVIITETGWPSDGGGHPTSQNMITRLNGTSIMTTASGSNAQTYLQNLISHVSGGKGTPKMPGTPLEAYIFAMFDENNKAGDEDERHFGIFTPSQQPKYQLNFH